MYRTISEALTHKATLTTRDHEISREIFLLKKDPFSSENDLRRIDLNGQLFRVKADIDVIDAWCVEERARVARANEEIADRRRRRAQEEVELAEARRRDKQQRHQEVSDLHNQRQQAALRIAIYGLVAQDSNGVKRALARIREEMPELVLSVERDDGPLGSIPPEES